MFEESGKSGRGGGIVGCHVTSRQGKPFDLAVSVRVARNMAAKLENCTKEEQRSVISFLWAESDQVDKFISACVLSMGKMLSLVELCMSGLKFLKMAVRV
jgi:hypothetical protein